MRDDLSIMAQALPTLLFMNIKARFSFRLMFVYYRPLIVARSASHTSDDQKEERRRNTVDLESTPSDDGGVVVEQFQSEITTITSIDPGGGAATSMAGASIVNKVKSAPFWTPLFPILSVFF